MQKTYYIIISLLFTFTSTAQNSCYKSLEEALKQKDCVTCLDLSKQRLKQIPDFYYTLKGRFSYASNPETPCPPRD